MINTWLPRHLPTGIYNFNQTSSSGPQTQRYEETAKY